MPTFRFAGIIPGSPPAVHFESVAIIEIKSGIMFKASIRVKLRPSILDPQGKATHHALQNLGFQKVERVRMGKYVEIWVDEEEEDDAMRVAKDACERLLANPVMEDFEITLERIAETA